MTTYAVMDIGCLCCYEPTELIAVTDEAGVQSLGAKKVDDVEAWQYALGLIAFPLPEPT